MYNIVFVSVFSLALVIANIVCFIKKKYLYIFIPCMLFLPKFYGIDFSESLPIITVSRMMFGVFFIYSILNRKRDIYLKHINLRSMLYEHFFLVCYFVLRIASNLFYVTAYGQAIKSIFLIIFEQLLLLIAVYMLEPSRKEVITLMKVIVWTATILFVVGILEGFFDARPFDALYTVSRELYNLPYYRLGLLRATATMYAPALYGNMCILIMPIIFYLLEITRKKIYIFAAGLCVLAIIHSGSRADIIFLSIIVLAYVLFVLRKKDRRLLFVKRSLIIVVSLFIYMTIASVCSEELKYFYVGTARSVLNEVGFDFDLNEGAPEGVNGFGSNQYGSTSRTRQFTAIYRAALFNPLFGFGAGAMGRGEVQYYWHPENGMDGWIIAKNYDVGCVELFCEEGLVGFLGMCSLLFYMMKRARNCKYYRLSIFCYLLTTLSTGNMVPFLMLYLILYYRPSYFKGLDL